MFTKELRSFLSIFLSKELRRSAYQEDALCSPRNRGVFRHLLVEGIAPQAEWSA
jgi:hypothetical protein